MVCEGITTLVMPIARWRRRFDALLAIKGIDVSVVGPVNLIHLKIIKDLYGDVQDFSKFEWLITGSGSGAGSGANPGTWTMSASTASTLRRVELEKIVNTIMQEAVTVHAHAYFTFITFTGGGFNGGALLDSGGKLYVMTVPFKGLNNELNWDLNGLNCQQDPMANLPPTLITNVYYKANDIAEAITINPFANARSVVVTALGAVNAAALLEQIYNRSANQSIRYVLRERNVAEYLIRRSNKVWNLVQRGIKAANFREIGVIDTANLEKLRSRLDETDMKIYNAPAKASADDKFATLKALSTQMVEIISDGGFTAGSIPGVGLPLSFTEWLNVLTRLLNEEKAEAYPVNVWAARLETYRLNLGRIVNVLREYAMGRLYQLTAIERAKKPDFPTIEECMTGTGNAPAPPGLTPAALQAVANLLSQLAGIKGQLELAGFTGKDLLQEGRVLRYAFKTRRVRFNGKKQFLTMVKLKESGKQTTYVAHFVDNKNVLNPSLDTAWWNPVYQ